MFSAKGQHRGRLLNAPIMEDRGALLGGVWLYNLVSVSILGFYTLNVRASHCLNDLAADGQYRYIC